MQYRTSGYTYPAKEFGRNDQVVAVEYAIQLEKEFNLLYDALCDIAFDEPSFDHNNNWNDLLSVRAYKISEDTMDKLFKLRQEFDV